MITVYQNGGTFGAVCMAAEQNSASIHILWCTAIDLLFAFIWQNHCSSAQIAAKSLGHRFYFLRSL